MTYRYLLLENNKLQDGLESIKHVFNIFTLLKQNPNDKTLSTIIDNMINIYQKSYFFIFFVFVNIRSNFT